MKHNPTIFCTPYVCSVLIALLATSQFAYTAAQVYSGSGMPTTDEPNDTEPDESVSPSVTSSPMSSNRLPMPSPSPNLGSNAVIEGCDRPAGAASDVTLVSESEMVLKARCYVACLDNVSPFTASISTCSKPDEHLVKCVTVVRLGVKSEDAFIVK